MEKRKKILISTVLILIFIISGCSVKTEDKYLVKNHLDDVIVKIDDVEYCVGELIREDKRPEIEVFELGMINTVHELDEKFHFVDPILFALVFGHGGEMPATENALRHMKEYLYETFPDEGKVLWGYTEANRKDFKMVSKALDMGAVSLRLGFEDSNYLENDVQCTTNAELIKAAAELLREKDMEPMTPDEVRQMLKIKAL